MHTTLHRYFQELQRETLPAYRLYIKNLKAGEEQEEGKIATHRDAIQEKFQFLEAHVEQLETCSDCLSLFQELQSHHDCIALQGILGEQLPFKLILDTAKRGNDEEGLLEPFVFQLYSHRTPVGIVHRALKAGVEKDLGLLENILQTHWENMEEDKAWALFDTVDRDVVMANSQLKKGTLLRSQQADGQPCEFVLGEELGPHLTKNRFFQLERYSIWLGRFAVPQKDADQLVLWFPPNEALPGLMRTRAKRHVAGTESHCLPLNCPSFVDPKGRFCLVEKLHTQLGSRKWRDEQTRYLPPVVSWLKWLKENQLTPSHFRPEYIFFNAKQSLTAVKLLKPLPSYDEKAIPAFIKLLTGDDAKLYQKIAKGIDN